MHTERVDRLISVIKYAVENGIKLDENSSDIFEKLQIERKIIPEIKNADEKYFGLRSIDKTIDQDLLQKALDIYNKRFGKKLTCVYNGKSGLRVVRNTSHLSRLKDATLSASGGDLNKHPADLEVLRNEEI